MWSELSSSQALLEAAEFDTELFAAYTQDWQDRVRVIGKYVRAFVYVYVHVFVYVCVYVHMFMYMGVWA